MTAEVDSSGRPFSPSTSPLDEKCRFFQCLSLGAQSTVTAYKVVYISQNGSSKTACI